MTSIPARGLPDTVTVLTATASPADEFGNSELDWGAATSRTIAAFVQPEQASELYDKGDRDALVGAYRMFTNDRQVGGLDRVVWNGITLEVVGPPGAWDNPAGFHHTELQLKYVEG